MLNQLNKPVDVDDDALNCFLCSITYEVMSDPVISPISGHSFERSAIETWLTKNPSDPISRQELNIEQLIPNRALQEAITVWKKLDNEWKEKAKALQAKMYALQDKQHNQEILHEQNHILRQRFKIELRKAGRSLEDIIPAIPPCFLREKQMTKVCDHASKSNFKKAIVQFEKLRIQYSYHDWFHQTLGRLYWKYGNQLSEMTLYNRAIECFKKAIEINPQNDEVYRIWGWVLSRIAIQSKDSLSIDALEALNSKQIHLYQQALSINANNPRTHYNLGWYYHVKGDDNTAIDHYHQSIKLDHNYGRPRTGLGDIYCRKNVFDKAEQHYLLAIHFGVKELDLCFFKLGQCYKFWYLKNEKKKPDRDILWRSVVAYEKSLAISPQFIDAFTQCAFCYNKLGDYKKAIKLYEDVLNIDSKHVYSYVQIGYCYTRLGSEHYHEAEKQYKKALDIDPENDKAKKNLRWLRDKISVRSTSYNALSFDNRGRSSDTSRNQADQIPRRSYQSRKIGR